MKAAGAFNGLPRELRCLKFTPHEAGDAAVRFYSLNKFAIKPCVCSVFGQLVSPQEHASARHSTTVLSPKGWVCSGRARRLDKLPDWSVQGYRTVVPASLESAVAESTVAANQSHAAHLRIALLATPNNDRRRKSPASSIILKGTARRTSGLHRPLAVFRLASQKSVSAVSPVPARGPSPCFLAGLDPTISNPNRPIEAECRNVDRKACQQERLHKTLRRCNPS